MPSRRKAKSVRQTRQSELAERISNEIHCPVCFLVYREPKALRCLHSLCGKCSKKLIQDSEIICPICKQVTREMDIVENFNIKTLVEIYEGKCTKLDAHDERLKKVTKVPIKKSTSQQDRRKQTLSSNIETVVESDEDDPFVLIRRSRLKDLIYVNEWQARCLAYRNLHEVPKSPSFPCVFCRKDIFRDLLVFCLLVILYSIFGKRES